MSWATHTTAVPPSRSSRDQARRRRRPSGGPAPSWARRGPGAARASPRPTRSSPASAAPRPRWYGCASRTSLEAQAIRGVGDAAPRPRRRRGRGCAARTRARRATRRREQLVVRVLGDVGRRGRRAGGPGSRAVSRPSTVTVPDAGPEQARSCSRASVDLPEPLAPGDPDHLPADGRRASSRRRPTGRRARTGTRRPVAGRARPAAVGRVAHPARLQPRDAPRRP